MVAEKTPSRRSSRTVTPVKRLDPSLSTQRSPDSMLKLSFQPKRKKGKKNTKQSSIPLTNSQSTYNNAPRKVKNDIFQQISKEKGNMTKVVANLVNDLEDNPSSIISLSLNAIVSAAGFKKNACGFVDENEVFNMRDLLEELCEDAGNTTDSDLLRYLFAAKNKEKHVKTNFKEFWRELGRIGVKLFSSSSLNRVFFDAFQTLLNFGIVSVRHCALIALSSFLMQLLEEIKNKRDELLSFVSVELSDQEFKRLKSTQGFIGDNHWDELRKPSSSQKLSQYIESLACVESLVKKTLIKIISQRSKDVNQLVRARVLLLLEDIAAEFCYFLETESLLKYIGWSLWDQSSSVRQHAVTTLHILFDKGIEQDAILARYKQRLIEMINDTDLSVAIKATDLLQMMNSQSEFSSDELYFIDSNMFNFFKDNYQYTDKLNTNKKRFLTLNQKLWNFFFSRFNTFHNEELSNQDISALFVSVLRLFVLHLGSSSLKERDNYARYLIDKDISYESGDKKLQLLSLPISFQLISFSYLSLLNAVSLSGRRAKLFTKLLDANIWILHLDKQNILKKQEILCIICLFRCAILHSHLEGLSVRQNVLLAGESFDFDFSVSRKNKVTMIQNVKTSGAICKSRIAQMLLRYSDDNLLTLQLVQCLIDCVKNDNTNDVDINEVCDILLNCLEQHSDETLILHILQLFQLLQGSLHNALYQEAKGHFHPKCIKLAENLIEYSSSVIQKFQNENMWADLNEELEITMSVNLFKILSLSQFYPVVECGKFAERIQPFVREILQDKNREMLCALSDSEKKQTIISCRGLFIKYFSKLRLLSLIRELISVADTELDIDKLKSDTENLLSFYIEALEVKETNSMMEADIKDNIMPLLSELYYIFSVEFLSKIFIRSDSDLEDEKRLFKIRSLVLDVSQHSERTILNLIQLRMNELHEDITEEKESEPDGNETKSNAQNLSQELFFEFKKDLRVSFTMNTLLKPIFCKCISADYVSRDNVKTVAFILQYCHNQPEFIEESVAVLVNKLFESPLHSSYCADIFFMSIKYVFSLCLRKVANDKNDKTSKKHAFNFIEKIFRICFDNTQLDKDVNNLQESTICKFFYQSAQFALTDFPENSAFFEFFAHYLLELKKSVSSRKLKVRQKAVKIFKSFRDLWVKLIMDLPQEVQGTLYGDTPTDIMKDFIKFESLLGVKVTLPRHHPSGRRSISGRTLKESLSPSPPDNSVDREALEKMNIEDTKRNIFSDSEKDHASVSGDETGPMLRRHRQRRKRSSSNDIDIFDEEGKNDSPSGKETEDEDENESSSEEDDISITGFAQRRSRRGKAL